MKIAACFAVLLLAACSSPGQFKGCGTSSVQAGDRLVANGQRVVVERVVGPSTSCSTDRPIEAWVRPAS